MGKSKQEQTRQRRRACGVFLVVALSLGLVVAYAGGSQHTSGTVRTIGAAPRVSSAFSTPVRVPRSRMGRTPRTAEPTRLSNQSVRERIPVGIEDRPATVRGKSGNWTGAAHDVAIVQNPLDGYLRLRDASSPIEFGARPFGSVSGYLQAAWSDPP